MFLYKIEVLKGAANNFPTRYDSSLNNIDDLAVYIINRITFIPRQIGRKYY